MKILLFGANGQVGWELQRSLSPLGEVLAPDRRSTELCGDLANLDGLARTVDSLRPDVIINAAAYTAVDMAESHEENARLVNTLGPEALAKAADACGAWLVHYSTDYVFDGTGDKPLLETDPTGPLNVYGRTKLEGEQRIADRCANHLIFRTSWVYALRGDNFVKTVLKLAQDRETLSVINDQFGAPTGADLLADVTSLALKQVAGGQKAAGIYHLTAAGETSWFEYAKYVLNESNRAQEARLLIAKNIQPVPTSAFPTAAKRPQNSRLNTVKVQTTFGLQLPPWQLGVRRMLIESNLKYP